ncbi:KGGVGR-motif variant AAA ATPase [Gordonia amarae]
MVAPELVLSSPDRKLLPEQLAQSGRVYLLERTAVGADWVRRPTVPSKTRIALYGFKGGVGRSTAAYMLAREFSRCGQVVLVVDLDLESPGISSLLVPTMEFADYGVVDHLVTAPVDLNPNLDIVTRAEISSSGNGEVWLAAAGGRTRAGYHYIEKLSRIYIDIPDSAGSKSMTFAERLENSIQYCERQVSEKSRQPDVVLLDSRAGIHDIAAIAITQLSTFALLFATDNRQTWEGYRELFRQWQVRLDPQHLSQVRERLQVVASMVPSRGREDYLARFRDSAQDCFADTLYDSVDAADSDAFSFSVSDESAPHYPFPILHSMDLVGIESSSELLGSDLVDAAYSQFLTSVLRMATETTNQ